MSVLANKRRESKFEAITFSIELHDMLLDLMRRRFGIKSYEEFVRSKYAYGVRDYEEYRYILSDFKSRIDQTASLLTSNVRAANSIYPTTIHEYENRRDYQNIAIANCEQLIKELQRIVEIFNVDINIYGKYITAIDREIGLIKKWRQRDNKIKSYLG